MESPDIKHERRVLHNDSGSSKQDISSGLKLNEVMTAKQRNESMSSCISITDAKIAPSMHYPA